MIFSEMKIVKNATKNSKIINEKKFTGDEHV
jgi:hypothetical protein